MTKQIDLSELAMRRPDRDASLPTDRSRIRSRRNWMSRTIVPGAILLGFVAMLAWAAREYLLPRKPVTVVPVVVTRAEVQQSGTILFQAPGWIEPRPTAVNVAALTEGTVEELLVVEGQSVEVGTPVARLIDVDAKLNRRESDVALSLREAELRSANAEQKAARLRVANPVHLDSALAEAEVMLAQAETELAKLPFTIESARARLTYAQTSLAGRKGAAAAVSDRLIHQAESEVAVTESECRELEQREPRLRQQVDSLQKKCLALGEQRKLLINETMQLEDANAKLSVAEARRDQAKLAVEKAQLQLERTVVRSPMQGRVMQLVARPGTRVMAAESSQSSSTVVTLYDPNLLQVRADVRLEDVPLVQPGQPIEIETASSREKIRGEVLTTTSSANIQKNTLEVKIAIHDPPTTIRPEMLVTATFIAPPQPDENESEQRELERLLVPKQLIDSSDNQKRIWIVDNAGRARRRTVRVGQTVAGELIEVIEGLLPTEKLVSKDRESLREGDRVEIVGEDRNLGIH